jgi:two-component system, chemotaxis family, CheB/CheR fusion protein
MPKRKNKAKKERLQASKTDGSNTLEPSGRGGRVKAKARAKSNSGSKSRSRELQVPTAIPESPRNVRSRRVEESAVAQSEERFPVVGIGASAGGLEALDDLLEHMPPDTGMSFVVVTHQHPGHTSLLPELLGKCTTMPVVQAKDGARLRPNCVYVAPPGGYVAVLRSHLHLMEGPAKKEIPPLPIDFFFRSLAADQKERAICIILSGTGSDGTLGLKAVKGESGMAMVQEVKSARYAGMPSSAIATSLTDYIQPPAAMPAQLIAYAKGVLQYGRLSEAEERVPEMEQPLQKVFLLLRTRTGHDFSSYKMSTMRRRIERRMNVHQISRAAQYVRFLQENPHEIDILFRELLIGVTNFFRDPEAFEVLAGDPLRDLFKDRTDNGTIRIWVPGCSSGEEAYSLAILFREAVRKLNRSFETQVFGTDLDTEAIEAARQGRYPAGIAIDVGPERLKEYFSLQDASYQIRKQIREMCIFAPQNLIKDPPFTKLDLISCRNLLIYLNSDLQKRLLPIFHYALKPGGILFLGPSETIGAYGGLFEVLDKRWKIYRRRELPVGHPLPEIPAQPAGRLHGEQTPGLPGRRTREVRISSLVEGLLLARFAPASVVINERGDIVYIHGRTGAYLEPGSGQPRMNILEMAREGLKIGLASAMREAMAQDSEAIREHVRVRSNGEFTYVNLSVARISEPEAVRGLLLVMFRPSLAGASKQGPKGKGGKSATGPSRMQEVERELRYTKESLQTTVEELETSNEELKSTNEELQSTNEELQSTNEELETSKEELQSLNEELTTVNTELQSKVEELSQSNDDMQNLLNSTDIATIFLDNGLHIKRYTEQAKRLVKFIQTDIGRPIGDLVSNLEYDGLEDDAREVLRTLVHKETEIRTKDGLWYLMRLIPYRTSENVIDGLVITFVDIGRMKKAEVAGAEAHAFFESIFDIFREPALVLNDQLRVVKANRSFYRTFRSSPRQTEGESIYDLVGGAWAADLRGPLEKSLAKDRIVEDVEVTADYPILGRRTFRVSARRLEQVAGLPGMTLLAMEDVTQCGVSEAGG